MKIIIADAKTLKVQAHPLQEECCLFEKKAMDLYQHLLSYDVQDIHDLMNISFKQSEKVYHDFCDQTLYPAMNLFHGVVYKQLQWHNYHQEDYQFLCDHLLINSPLYGLLRPQDLIYKHRLEIKHRLNNINLYNYWHDELYHYLKDEDFILSLSTKEYEKMIDHPHLIQVDFQEVLGDQVKRRATYLKQARGQMLDIIIKNHYTSLEDIKKIVIDDYVYVDHLSSQHKLVFQRQLKMTYHKL